MWKVTVSLLVLLCTGFAQAPKDPAPCLPEPDGPHGVGVVRFLWTDADRAEEATEDPEDRRRLVVDLWYPARRAAKAAERLPYVPFAETMRPLLDEQYGPRRSRLERLRIPAAEGASPVRTPRRLPVVLLSHGLRTARIYYQGLALALASHGFVVCSLDHTYDIEGVALPSGELLRRVTRPKLEGSANPFERLDATASHLMRIWAEDHAFVLDRLALLQRGEIGSPLKGRLELERVGIVGHCYGGSAAFESAIRDDRIGAVVALNGWPVSGDVLEKGLGKTPVLLLYSEFSVAAEGLLERGIPKEKVAELQQPLHELRRREMAQRTEGAIELTFSGAHHMSFTDMANVMPWLHAQGEEGPGKSEVLDLALPYVVGFLGRALQGKKAPLLEEGAQLPAGVSLQRLK